MASGINGGYPKGSPHEQWDIQKPKVVQQYQTLKPTHAFPIHGESFFLKVHKEFIDTNKLADFSHMILNGDEIVITDKEIKINKINY